MKTEVRFVAKGWKPAEISFGLAAKFATRASFVRKGQRVLADASTFRLQRVMPRESIGFIQAFRFHELLSRVLVIFAHNYELNTICTQTVGFVSIDWLYHGLSEPIINPRCPPAVICQTGWVSESELKCH